VRYPYAYRYPTNVYAHGVGVPIRGPYHPYYNPAYYYPYRPYGYFAPHPPRPSPAHHFVQRPVVESTTMANVEPPKPQPLVPQKPLETQKPVEPQKPETLTEQQVTTEDPDDWAHICRSGARCGP
jgi:hypothetical protein